MDFVMTSTITLGVTGMAVIVVLEAKNIVKNVSARIATTYLSRINVLKKLLVHALLSRMLEMDFVTMEIITLPAIGTRVTVAARQEKYPNINIARSANAVIARRLKWTH